MATITVHLATGRRVGFEIDFGLQGSAYFALSIRKCGSSVFNAIVEALAQANDCRFVDVGGGFFFENVVVADYQRDPAIQAVLYPGHVYTGFRNMPLAFLGHPLFQAGPKILFVRDPRDALVSEYFSNAYSHPIPPPGAEGDAVTRNLQYQRATALAADIDAVVTRGAANMGATFTQYSPILGEPRTKVLRYEDYIFRKRELIREIAGHFGWRADERLTEAIVGWADVRPEREDPTAFIRKVVPGDHREKLRRETIAAVEKTLGPAMALFGYSAGS